MPYYLLNIYNKESLIEFDITNSGKTRTTLGRSRDNDIVLDSSEVSGREVEFNVTGGACYIKDLSGRGIMAKDEKIQKKCLEEGDVFFVGKSRGIAIIPVKIEDTVSHFKIGLDGTSSLVIGKNKTNHIVLNNTMVSREHARIDLINGGQYRIKDCNSKNGLFVNSIRISEKTLDNNDIINILGYRFVYQNNSLYILCDGKDMTVNGLKTAIIKESSDEIGNIGGKLKKIKRHKARYPYFQRSPRFIPEIPSGDMEILSPPHGSIKPDISWVSILLPPIAMIAVSVAMAFMIKGPYIYLTLAMTGVTVIVSVVNYLSQNKKFKNDEQKRKTSYLDYINKTRAELEQKREQHGKALNQIHPPVNVCVERVEATDRKLWERNPLNEDFLDVRIGKGSHLLKLAIKTPRQEISAEHDPLKDEAQKIADDFKTVDDVPISVSLLRDGTVGLIGDRGDGLNIAKSIIIQTAAHHSYDEVKIVCIFPDRESDEWDWVRWIPHVWDDSRQARFVARDKASAHEILTVLYDEIKLRENMRLSGLRQTDSMSLPIFLFILADAKLIQNEPIMSYLIHNNQHLGIATLFFFDRIEFLPKDCRAIIEADRKKGQIYWCDGPKDKVAFKIDRISAEEADYFARKIAPVRLKHIASASTIPDCVKFLEAFDAVSMDDLKIKDRWLKGKPYRSLAVPIGRVAGGDPQILDIHEKAYGPHGLVAGTTGSGKSELLQSVILAMAVNYHPHDVVFVIIDYKGGGMANCFIGLPHLVGTITNLGGNETKRALLSIKSELKRRQTMLAQQGVNNIDSYIRLYKEGKADLPLPHLVIVADEFAELKAEQPDFMRELVSAARVGRSLGVHLILATQKPSGVVDDQIWSNSRFKLCLKVQEAADSQEVIKRPDAANIKLAGRCIIQVGNNEVFEQFQSSWSGAVYDTSGTNTLDGEVFIINLDGSRRRINYSSDATVFMPESLTQLKAAVEYMKNLSSEIGISPLSGIWLPPLPERLFLNQLIKKENSWNGNSWGKAPSRICPVIGLVDNPAHQMQEPLKIDLDREGHLSVYGAPGTGKTTFIKTLVTSLALNYSPNEANIYLLDFGGRTMGVFSDLPHVGGIVYGEDEEKLYKLFKLLFKEIEKRKRSFSEIGVNSLSAYKKSTGEGIPAIVVAIDNYSALNELYPDVEDMIIPLSREGGNYGIHIVVTANSTNAIRYKVSQNIKCSVALQMADRGDYASIVGRTEGLEPANVPGRGLIKSNPPLEFHTALPVKSDNEAEMTFNMKEMFRRMAECWEGRRAKPIPVLPEILTMEEMLQNDDVKARVKSGSALLPVGLDTENMEPEAFDLSRNFCLLISGQPGSGKTSFLKTMVSLIPGMLPEEKLSIHIVDTPEMGLAQCKDSSAVRSYITESDQFSNLMKNLIEDLNLRKRSYNEDKRSSQEPVNEYQYINEKYGCIVILVDNISEFIKMIEDDAKDSFERIVRFGKGLGVFIIITGNSDDISKLNHIDSLTKAIVELQCGIALGGSFDQHNFFNINMPYQERSKPIMHSEGYVIEKGRCKKIKIAIKRNGGC